MLHEKDYFEHISPTAYLAAAYRSLTDIPLAKDIYDNSLASIYHDQQIPQTSISHDLIPRYEARYKLVDLILNELGVKDTVELAAGLSTRGINATNKATQDRYTELDLPAVVAEKRKLTDILKNKGLIIAESKLSIIEGNALNISELVEAEGEPLVIVNEGLLRYLNLSEITDLAKQIRDLLKARKGYWVTPDISLKSFYEGRTTISSRLADLPQDNIFDNVGTARDFFSELGFSVGVRAFTEVESELSSVSKYNLSHKSTHELLDGSVAFVLKP